MPNQYKNKVQYIRNGVPEVLVDLTSDTVTPEVLMQGYTAHDASGAPIVGSASSAPAGIIYITDEVDANGSTIRSMNTDGATITDTVDEHGGTVRSITGVEVYLQSKTVQPTESAQSVTPDTGYGALGAVNVGAIPSNYVGSGVTQRASSDLTASGATVTAPAGYYPSAASKSVASGTEGTPIASKGSVSNHSISVTPSVTNTAGYISGGTKTGTAVSVSASELVSGNKAITENGTGIDVTNYASVDVVVPTGTTIPTFTITIDSLSQIASVTCDMTYAQCAELLGDGEPYASVVIIFSDSSTQKYGASGLADSSSLYYVALDPTNLEPVFEIEYDNSGNIDAWAPPSYIQTLSVTQNGTYYGLYNEVDVSVPSSAPSLQSKTATPSTSQQTITADSGYDGLSSVTVAAMPTGTAGIPTATKGTVSNHSVSITPSVTNTTGYITGGTKTGTAVTVSASELVSGNKEITDNGTNIDVTNYASVDVNVASSGGWDYQPKNDGLTHVWFDVTCPDLLRVGLWLRCPDYTNEYIDWGDGTIDDNFQEPDTYAMHYHTYSSLGTYCVTLSSKFFIINKTTTSGGVGADVSAFLYSLMAVELAANGTINEGFLAEYPALKWVYYHDGTLSSYHDYNYELRYNPSLQYFRMAYSSTTPSTYTMGMSAFHSDTNLIRVDNWDYVTQIGENAFTDCSAFNPSSLPSALTTIDQYAFQNCKSLALTSLPSTVTSIGPYAFDGCDSLALTSLPSGITSIAQHTFTSCYSLALTSLPSGLTSIAQYAFSSCRSLALTSLPSGVTSIGARAFFACHSLALTSLPSGITSIAEYTFQACLAMPLSSLPSGVTSIGQYAFNACTSMTSISCAGNITTLATHAFDGNATYPSALTRVDFPNMSVSSMGTVFGNATASGACQFLAIADIGKTASLGSNAFANCYALQTLVLRRDTAICNLTYATAFTNTPMAGYNNLTGTVYVPNSLISTYQTATNWTTLYNNGTVTFVAIEGSPYEL